MKGSILESYMYPIIILT